MVDENELVNANRKSPSYSAARESADQFDLGFSDEELDAAEKQPGGHTTSEVLACLRSLGSKESEGAQDDDKRCD